MAKKQVDKLELEENQEDILTSEENVKYVLDFAQGLMGITGQPYLSPAMMNARMQDIYR